MFQFNLTLVPSNSVQDKGKYQNKRLNFRPLIWYTHKTSGFKTSGFKTSGFKTSETPGLHNVSFTKRQVYKMSGLQNVRSSKHPIAKKHPYISCTCGWWKSAGSVVQ